MYEQYTDKQIVEMLVPKLNKAVPNVYWDACAKSPELNEKIIKAIATVYRSAYIRGQLGRSFIIGEKKKKGGHWEPVDPNNLPKEGTMVRYSRECKAYKDYKDEIGIGNTGVVNFEGPEHEWFGITLDNPHRYKWVCFDETEDCLDMWVEEEE